MGTTGSLVQSRQLQSFRNLRSMPSLTQPVRQPSTLGPLLDLNEVDRSPAIRMGPEPPNISSALKEIENLPRPSRSRRYPAPSRTSIVSSIRRMTSQLKSMQQQICVSSAVLKVMSVITMKVADIQESKQKINRLGSLDLDRIYARAQLGNRLSGLRQQVASLQGLLTSGGSPSEREVLEVLTTKPASSPSQASPNIQARGPVSQRETQPTIRPPSNAKPPSMASRPPPKAKPPHTTKLSPAAVNLPPTARPPSMARPTVQSPSLEAKSISQQGGLTQHHSGQQPIKKQQARPLGQQATSQV